ncbi:MAG: hypothetical protein AAF697_03015 [Pseudomonadota bacterium]
MSELLQDQVASLDASLASSDRVAGDDTLGLASLPVLEPGNELPVDGSSLPSAKPDVTSVAPAAIPSVLLGRTVQASEQDGVPIASDAAARPRIENESDLGERLGLPTTTAAPRSTDAPQPRAASGDGTQAVSAAPVDSPAPSLGSDPEVGRQSEASSARTVALRSPQEIPDAVRVSLAGLAPDGDKTRASAPDLATNAAASSSRLSQPLGPLDSEGTAKSDAPHHSRLTPLSVSRLAAEVPADSKAGQAPANLTAALEASAQQSATQQNSFQQASATVLAQPAGATPGLEAKGEIRSDARIAPQIETAIESLSGAREAGRNARPELNLRHGEFGSINVRLEAAGSDLRATLSARDPGFVPAIQAALAERLVAATSDTAASHNQRGQDQTGYGSQNSAYSQSGASDGQSGSHYGSSTGSEQASSQPYSEQTNPGDEELAAGDDRSGGGTVEQEVRRGGLYA